MIMTESILGFAALYLMLIIPFFKNIAWKLSTQLSHNITTPCDKFHHTQTERNYKDHFWLYLVIQAFPTWFIFNLFNLFLVIWPVENVLSDSHSDKKNLASRYIVIIMSPHH